MIVPFLQARHRRGEDEPYKNNAFDNGQATKQKEPESSGAMLNRVTYQAQLPADLGIADERGINAHFILGFLRHSLCYEVHCLLRFYMLEP